MAKLMMILILVAMAAVAHCGGGGGRGGGNDNNGRGGNDNNGRGGNDNDNNGRGGNDNNGRGGNDNNGRGGNDDNGRGGKNLKDAVAEKLGEWLRKSKDDQDRDCRPSKPNMGGKIILPTQNANGNCTNNDGDYVEQICASMCYDCVCGDSKFNKTCFIMCKFILSTNGSKSDICDDAVQTTGNNTAFDQCAAQAWTDRQLSANTDYACNQACNCCDLNTNPEVDCYAQCKNSAAFYTMGKLCQAFSKNGLVGGTSAGNLGSGFGLLAGVLRTVLG